MNFKEINNEFIEKNVTVIIRTVGERTEELCYELLKKQISEKNIHVIRETPFTEAVRKTFELGSSENRKWTFVIDADVLIRPAVVEKMINYAEELEENVFEIEGKIIDKFLFSPRQAGNHLYRTSLMSEALLLIPDPYEAIRPESHVKKLMLGKGYPNYVIDLIVGLHDYEQYYCDIYRKCFIQAKKHYEYVLKFIPTWEHSAEKDNDYYVGILGFNDGKKHEGKVSIDKENEDTRKFEKYNIKEKNKDINEEKIKNYEKYFMSSQEYLEYKKKRKAKTVIYTAIAGGFDNLIQHTYVSKEIDYVCFSDTPIENPGIWEIRPLEHFDLDDVRRAKYYKFFPNEMFPDYKFSVWIDGNIDVLGPSLEERVNELIESESRISANVHHLRSCTYEEANACLYLSKDDPFTIQKHIDHLKEQAFAPNAGLFEMFIVFRNHHDDLIKAVMDDWWYMISNYSRRDQLSFMYLINKHFVKCDKLFPTNIRIRNDFFLKPHNKKIQQFLFIDTGEGFREKEFAVKNVVLDSDNGFFEVEFDLKEFLNVNNVRFHPIKDSFCNLKIERILLKNKKDIKEYEHSEIIGNNSDIKEFNKYGQIEFENINPNIKITTNFEISSVYISGYLIIVPTMEKINNIIKQKDKDVVILYKNKIFRYFNKKIKYLIENIKK